MWRYVTTVALPNTGATSATLVATDASGAGSFLPASSTTTVDAGGTQVAVAPVTLSNGSGTAVWEVLDADPSALESYTFGLAVAYASAPPATATVSGEFGPISTVLTADSSAPVPRFGDSTTGGGSTGCGTPPCLTTLPTAISLAYQTASADPSPVSLQLGSTGPSLPFTASVLATQDGWLNLSATSGATPQTIQVNFTPDNLPPGLYQASINLSSPTSAFPDVSVPVILTVTTGTSGYLPLGCSASVPAPPLMRQGGIAERTGDLIMLCANGTPTAAGVPVPAYDVHLTLPAPITSRIYSNGWSEVLLIFDEPNTWLPGATNTLRACSDPSGICTILGSGNGVGTYDGTAGHPNVFPGKISGNTVTFPGVPIDPPGVGGILAGPNSYERIMRIVNVRTDTTALTITPPATLVTGTVSAGVLAISNPAQTFGFVLPALSFSTRTPDDSATSSGAAINQCTATTPQRAGVLRFTEGYTTTFLPRTIAGYIDTETSPAPAVQNVPGTIYNVESGFYDPSVISPLVDFTTVGLANAGTRLRAQIDNLPAGTRVFVSTVPVTFTGGVPSVSTGAIARLVPDEMVPFAPAAATTTLDGIPAAELTVNNGAATAVWEVLTANPAQLDNRTSLSGFRQAAPRSLRPASPLRSRPRRRLFRIQAAIRPVLRSRCRASAPAPCRRIF